jgi:hypothetical protein
VLKINYTFLSERTSWESDGGNKKKKKRKQLRGKHGYENILIERWESRSKDRLLMGNNCILENEIVLNVCINVQNVVYRNYIQESSEQQQQQQTLRVQ